MASVQIDDVVVPATIDASDADAFLAGLEITNLVQTLGFGTPDLNYSPAEELPYWHDPHRDLRMVLARIDGRPVGSASYDATTEGEADTAWLQVQVLPEFRGHGVGRALADALERIARDEGKAKAIVYTPIPDAPGAQLVPPTGVGSIPADDRDVRFLQHRGYRLEQLERCSRLALPVAGLEERLAAAEAATGADYEVVTWVGGSPDRWLDDMAVLATRMTTDAPSAGLEEPEDPWDAQRVREADARDAASPRLRLVAAARHVATDRLAGYTVLSVPAERERAVGQYATLVLREHRGHRLGMLLKVANLAHLERVRPGHPSVTTFNAQENRFMLDVNEAVGFVPIANESAWRLDL